MIPSHPTYQGSIAINAHIRINLPSKADEGNSEIWFLLSRHVRDDGQPPSYISLHVFQEDGGSVSFVQPEYLTVRVTHSISHRAEDGMILIRINRGYTRRASITWYAPPSVPGLAWMTLSGRHDSLPMVTRNQYPLSLRSIFLQEPISNTT